MATRESGGEAESYWYSRDGASAGRAIEVLQALRNFHAADFAMRQRLKNDMDMNETDLRALRQLIAAESGGIAIGPKDLTRRLGISSAATAKLLSRLAGSGHIRREPNPLDRRAQLLYATTAAHQEIRKTLATMHARMLAVAERLTPEQQCVVIHFLDRLSAAVDAPNEVAAHRVLSQTLPPGEGPTEPNGAAQ